METITVSSAWQKGKLLVKGLIIGGLVLVLLIPAFFVENLIREREQRQREAVAEVSGKWAGRQNVTGPVIVIPYRENMVGNNGQIVVTRHHAYYLPEKLEVSTTVKPEKRYRGIYQVMLYTSTLQFTGNFAPVKTELLNLSHADMLWNEAYVAFGVADARGLKNEVQLQWNDSVRALSSAASPGSIDGDILAMPLENAEAMLSKGNRFSTAIQLNGSEQLLFTPTGKETLVNIQSEWPDPSFTGGQLPETSDIKKSGFTARWKSLAHTRKIPQQWKDKEFTIGGNGSNGSPGMYRDQALSAATPGGAFGVDLFVPVSGYQKTMRSVKYAILCILFTFAAFFIIETINKRSVHPFQYGLIGLALILFYTLLLSISEYTGFDIAYLISALATTGLIAWFVKGILQSSRFTGILSMVLVMVYSYVFTILQLQDYSLLLGSVGLFATLAIIMHFSKKIQW